MRSIIARVPPSINLFILDDEQLRQRIDIAAIKCIDVSEHDLLVCFCGQGSSYPFLIRDGFRFGCTVGFGFGWVGLVGSVACGGGFGGI